MIKTSLALTQEVFQSEVMPDISTTNPNLSYAIAWADQHLHAWKIVTTRRSKAFGIGSCVYIGWAQKSMESGAVLERLRHFKELATGRSSDCNPDSIFVWRAKFTFKHFLSKRFTGGFFQQHDARYPRSCLTLDYTPETLEEVIDRFCQWMDKYFETRRITLNQTVVRTFPSNKY